MLLINIRKILLIVAVVVFGLVCAFGIYWFFFRPSPERLGYLDSDITGGPGGQLPQAGTGLGGGVAGEPGTLPGLGDVTSDLGDQIGRLAPEQTPPDIVARGSNTLVLPFNENRVGGVSLLSGKRGFVFYDQEDGKFYRLTDDGQKYSLSDRTFHLVDNVAWSGDGGEAIIEYPDGSNIYYNFETDKAVTLPREMEEPSFSESGEKIAFKFVTENEDNNWLVISDPNGERIEPIEPIGDRSYLVQVGWSPNSQIVAFYHRSAGLNKEEIFLIGRYGENLQSIEVQGMGFKGIWSPAGDRILYHVVSVTADYKPELWIVGARSGNIGLNNLSLGLNTWVDKCVFASSGKVVYCAVPQELPTGAGLYPDTMYLGADVFYRIDLTTGLKSIVANPVLEDGPTSFNADQVFLSEAEDYLYFWDKITEKVYQMRLK